MELLERNNPIQAVLEYAQSMDDVNPDLVWHYQVGLILGVLVVTTLHFFPGKPLGIQYSADDANKEKVQSDVALDEALQQSTTTDGKNGTTIRKEWAGDEIPALELEKIRVKLGLTDDQMKQALDAARRQQDHSTTATTTTDGRALQRQVNFWVYTICILLLIYVINRDYNDYVAFWFGKCFPREATTLGMNVPQPIVRRDG